VAPEGGMKATAHWLELKDYTPKSPSTSFANVFSEQVLDTAKIEERRVLRWFFQRTGQTLYQERLIDIIKRLSAHLPIKLFATPLSPMSRR
jgi:heterodisulfide reductase subunit C